jgi:hypothetical protein
MKCRKVIVVLLVLGVIGGVIGSSALAAPKKPGQSSKTELTLLDPFTLRTLTVRSVTVSDTLLTRRPIRVPMRPQTRSAFRPNWR